MLSAISRDAPLASWSSCCFRLLAPVEPCLSFPSVGTRRRLLCMHMCVCRCGVGVSAQSIDWHSYAWPPQDREGGHHHSHDGRIAFALRRLLTAHNAPQQRTHRAHSQCPSPTDRDASWGCIRSIGGGVCAGCGGCCGCCRFLCLAQARPKQRRCRRLARPRSSHGDAPR